MKKLLLSVLALSVVVPFTASAHTLLDGNGNVIKHDHENGDPRAVVQAWGKTMFQMKESPCKAAWIPGTCVDITASQPKAEPKAELKAEPTTEDLLKQLEVLKQALLALLAQLQNL